MNTDGGGMRGEVSSHLCTAHSIVAVDVLCCYTV